MDRGSYRHFLFDLDGTLVDSSEDLVAATNAALRSLGLGALPSARVIGFVGNGVRRLVERAVDAAAPGAGDQYLEPALIAFDSHYAGHLLDHTRIDPALLGALEAMAGRGATLSLLTNKPRRFAENILDRLGLSRLFPMRVCGDDVADPKPDPTGAEALVWRSGVPRVGTVLVGDSTIDVVTARAAGIASAVVTWGFVSREALLAARPDHVVESAPQLIDLCAPG